MPNPTNYGYHYAVLSKYAYFDEDEGIIAYQELGYKNVTFVDENNTQGYLMEDDTRIVIAARGTQLSEAKDIITDLKIIQTKSRTKGGVHDGFYDDTNEIWKQVLKYINDDSRKYKKIWACGHSLGGALATILASRLHSRIAACYTYGCPRVGNKRWAKAQMFSNHRFVNNNDIVPRIPPIWLCYRHYGELHYINYYGKIRDLSFWQKIKDQLRGRFRALRKFECFDDIKDHDIDQYVRKLKNM